MKVPDQPGRDSVESADRPRRRISLATVFFGTVEQRVEAVAIAVLFLAGLGWWAYSGVKSSLEASRQAHLSALLEAKVIGLEAWIEAKRAEANRWAAVADVAEAVGGLADAAGAGASGAELRAHPAAARFSRLLSPAVATDSDRVAATAIDRSGRIVAALLGAQLGMTVGPEMRRDIEPVFRGESRFSPPRPESRRLPDAREPVFTRPVAWFAAPVRGANGDIAAALAIGSFADARFARILAPPAGREADSSTDAYAFDASGLLLTASRYTDVLQAAGLVAAGASTAAFRVRLRDPGLDLRDDGLGGADPDLLPFTRLVDGALRSRGASDRAALRGVLIEPYRNYIGREVIGAWQWLPEYDIGVAIEIAASEAFAPIRYLTLAFTGIFTLLVLAVAVALASSFSLAEAGRAERRLGQYRIGEKIDEGGMATVHRAVHALLKRPTAVKILKRHLATDELVARFEREVMLASRLQHPSTVEIFDYGRTRDGTFYYAMEYIDGITLATLVEKDGPQPPSRVAFILKQVCGSLREAHSRGFVHRDIKPANIMICERGGESDVAKVLDFGLVKDLNATESRDITQFARLLGTPAYMAPERIRDPAEAAPAVDIYAVGAVAFLLLTGRRVFEAPNEMEMTRLVLEAAPPRASSVAAQPLPQALDDLVAACLAKDPADRPQRVEDLVAVFDRCLREQPWSQAQATRWWQEHTAVREMAAV